MLPADRYFVVKKITMSVAIKMQSNCKQNARDFYRTNMIQFNKDINCLKQLLLYPHYLIFNFIYI